MAVSPRGFEGLPKKTTKAIREWAIREGREVSSRGRIPAEIVHAFDEAQAKKVQVEPAPVKKTAVKKGSAKAAAKNTAPATRAAASKAPAKKTTKAIREWAIREGREVSSRGRIPAEIEL
ncbi:Lsr2 family DNA-binding protein, partial [Rhodococcus wratislaviensis]